MLAYYPNRSSPLLVNIGSRGVTGAVALVPRDESLRWKGCLRAWHGHWELGAAALLKAVWWGMRLASLLTHLYLYFFVFCVSWYFWIIVLLCCHYQCNWLPGKTIPQMTGILCVTRDVKQLLSVHSITHVKDRTR